MAGIIPRVAETVRMQSSSPVAIASTGDARIQGEAIQRFGQGVTEFGQKQLEFSRQNSRDEFLNEMQNVQTKAALHAEQNAAPDGSDYGQKFNEVADQGYTDAINKFGGGDPHLSREFESVRNRFKGDADTTIAVQSVKRLEQYNFDTFGKIVKDSGDRVREKVRALMSVKNPDWSATEKLVTAETQAFGASVDARVQKGTLTAQNAVKVRQAFNETVAKATIDGLSGVENYGKAISLLQANQVDQKSFAELDPTQAKQLGFIDSHQESMLNSRGEKYKIPTMVDGDKAVLTNEVASVMSGLDPADKAHMIDQMQAKLKERTEVRMSDLNANISGFEQLAMEGKSNDNDKSLVLKDATAAPMPDAARRRVIDRILTADAIGKTIKMAGSVPRAQLNGADFMKHAAAKIDLASKSLQTLNPALQGMDKDVAVRANRFEKLQMVEKAVDQVKRAQDKDPAGYLIQNDTQIGNLYRATKSGDPQDFDKYATTLMNKQKYLGFGSYNLLPKDEAASMAHTLASIQDADGTNQLLTQMEGQYGKNLPKVMNEIAQHDKSLSELKLIPHVPSYQRLALIDGVKNAPAINEALKKDDTLKVNSKTASFELSKLMAPFNTALVGVRGDSAGVQTSNGLMKLAEAQANRDVLKGADPQEAARTAYNDVVGSNFNVVAGGRSSVLVPRQLGSYQIGDKETKIFKTFMDHYSTPEGLRELNVRIPKAHDVGLDWETNQATAAANHMAPDSKAKNWLTDYSKSVRWITNDTQTGLVLVKQNVNGTTEYVKDRGDRRVEKTFQDIYLHPSKAVIEQNKGIIEKLFGD